MSRLIATHFLLAGSAHLALACATVGPAPATLHTSLSVRAERAGPSPRQSIGRVRVELISATTTESFAGAVALLEVVSPLSEVSRVERWGASAYALSIPASGELDFEVPAPGLYRLHLVDALGMPFLHGEASFFASADVGGEGVYRVQTLRLDVVKGLVLDASADVPVSGATVRVDPRHRVRCAPDLYVVTDEQGMYQVSTARSEVIAVDAADYRTINARFGPAGRPGPLRVKPMVKRRAVALEPQPADGAVDGAAPTLTYSESHTRSAAAEGSFQLAPESEGAKTFINVLYSYCVAEWPLDHSSGANSAKPTILVHEFLTRRGGGQQSVELALPKLRPATMGFSSAFDSGWSFDLEVGTGRRTSVRAHGRPVDGEAMVRFGAPVVTSGTDLSPWRIGCTSSDSGAHAYLTWQGEALDPAADGEFGVLRSLSAATDVGTGAVAIVFDGAWLSTGVTQGNADGQVDVPAFGTGDLYASSLTVRGDIARSTIGSAESEASGLELVHSGDLSSLDITLLLGDVPARSVAVRVVPKGSADLSNHMLDHLGETPLVSDASGTLYLRRFEPGEYELRIDPTFSSPDYADATLGTATLTLAPGKAQPTEIAVN